MSRLTGTAAHLTRKELALDRRVWRATGGMTLFLATAMAVLPLLDEGQLPIIIGLIALVFVGIGGSLLAREPPPIGSTFNHAVVALPWFGSAVIFGASGLGAGVAIGAAMFIGPLASVRLQDQRQFVLHLACATFAFVVAAAARGFPTTLSVSLLITTMAMWVLGLSCWVVLSMAEAQGHELDRLVRRDPLTGIGNLRLLEERLEQAVERHQRTRQPFSIILLDLNGFKAINDDLGHADGDALLRGVATALERAINKDDTVVRQGGDEFCVLLPQADTALATRTINAIKAGFAGVGDGVTAGFGVAEFPQDAVNPEVLMHVADARLREDKAGGPPRRGSSRPADEDTGPLEQRA